MTKRKRPQFIEPELIGDHLLEDTLLLPIAADDEPIDVARPHPEVDLPGGKARNPSRSRRPPRTDPRYGDQSVLPGRKDMPAGSERPAPSGSS